MTVKKNGIHIAEVRNYFWCICRGSKKKIVHMFIWQGYHSQQTKMSVNKNARQIVLCLTIALWLTLYILYIIPVKQDAQKLVNKSAILIKITLLLTRNWASC